MYHPLVEGQVRLSANFLNPNADKTELLLIGNPMRVAKVQNFELAIGNSVIRPWAFTGNLGVIFDDTVV